MAAAVDIVVVIIIVCEFVCLHVLDVCVYACRSSNVCKFTYNESGLVGQSRAEL